MQEFKKGSLTNKQFNIERRRSHHKNGKDKTKVFNHSIITFDIEVTSAWIDEHGQIIGYRKGETAEYWNELTPLSLCYIWQCGIDGVVYYGRELSQFTDLLDELPTDAQMIIWVHNLAYEYHFLANILTWEKVFARSPHKPMKATAEEYPNIEFRCSYMLTRLSLETWGEQIGLNKLVGNLDYEKIRTPLTPLTQLELDYAERDCLVVEQGIKQYIDRYGTQFNIPLTQTGTVRLEVKNRLFEIPDYTKYIKRLIPHNAQEYKRLQEVFAGGYTHANRYFSGQVISAVMDDNGQYEKDTIIQHYDFSSSYPTVMISEKYPCSPWIYIGHTMPNIKEFNDKAFIFILTFKNIECQTFNTYIQASKCKGYGFKYDNGRVISADELTITITEQDYLTIIETYKFSEMIVERVYTSYKHYLPTVLVSYILELYGNKTSLKDVDGQEEIYLQSKQYINSLFGMSVTALMQSDVNYDSGTGAWFIEPLTAELVEEKLQSLKKYYPKDKRYFLNYSWGCWVTAYARRNLWKCIIPYDDEIIYCDTDSVFILGEHDYKWYDEEVTQKLKNACEYHNIDFELTRPKTKKGKQKPLGIFTREEDCIEFVTLGAKRYCERRVDGKLYLTVSGINKKAVELLNNDIANFHDGFNFDKDAECVTKRLSTYTTNQPTVTYPDGYISTYKYGINMRRNGYNLTMTDEYKTLIEYSELTIEDLPDHFINKLRGKF